MAPRRGRSRLAGLQVGHVAADRGAHLGTFEIETGLLQGGFGKLHVGLGQAEAGLVPQQLGLGQADVGLGLFVLFHR